MITSLYNKGERPTQGKSKMQKTCWHLVIVKCENSETRNLLRCLFDPIYISTNILLGFPFKMTGIKKTRNSKFWQEYEEKGNMSFTKGWYKTVLINQKHWLQEDIGAKFF